MKTFQVYPIQKITISSAKGAYVYDENQTKYLDFYGGHAVISIGHSHEHYVKKIENQLHKIGFYSNSIQIPIQEELAQKLGKVSAYENYDLFLCNSGAEANENALKLASFHTGKSRVLAFNGAFHGRTSGAVAITDNPKIVAPFTAKYEVDFCSYNLEEVEIILAQQNTCAVIYEPIQGVGSIVMPSDEFVKGLRKLCTKYQTILIADEIQSGYGRSGKFFAHQHSEIEADIITTAKGMGNGFPIGGVLISPIFKASYGLLGTTFGGNHLACAAALAVLEVIENENLIENTTHQSHELISQLQEILEVKEIRGRGLMIGVKFDFPIKDLKDKLLFEEKIFVGNANDPTVLRLLPPLTITKKEVDVFVNGLKNALKIL